MTTAVGEDEIRVIISKGHLTAEMLIPAGFTREKLSEDLCINLLQQSGVEITEPVLHALKTMLAQPIAPGAEQRVLLAQATPAQTGADGSVEWLVPQAVEAPSETAQPDEKVSHYARSAYIVVQAGDVVGRVIPPTDGIDGRDVLGQPIAARPGKPAIMKTDESVAREASGRLIAEVEGVLHRQVDSVYIRQLIEVPAYVDFSTGNIDFTGDLVVRQGVRDCFVVKATGSVDIHGLIEAATINCGADLIARGGMAGRERGFARVGGNLIGKYLDNIQAEIHGDVEIHREVINCELTVHGAIRSPRGTVIGGRAVVTGAVELLALGSGADVTTELVLGSVPRLQPIADELDQLMEKLTAKRNAIENEQELMKKKPTRLITNADKERQTELIFEHQTVVSKLSQGQAAQEALNARIKQLQTVDLLIHRDLFPGVVLTVGNQSFKIHDEKRGPLQIFLDGRGELAYRIGQSENGPLGDIAEVRAAASVGANRSAA